MTGILTSDLEEIVDPQKTPLTVEECLGEFNDGQKALARENLDVYDRNMVYTKQDSDKKLNETIKKAFEKYLNEEDPHSILPEVRQMIEGFVRADGNTPFTAPQQGVDPVQDFHLATKRFVTEILRDHINDDDPHRIIPQVEDTLKNMLEQYVKQADVYFKSQLYTKDESDSKYIRKDGKTPFTKAQIGADPQIDSHLATKRYVDKEIYNHLIDVDPHGFIAILDNRLAAYAKTSNVYDKSQTYSRVQTDSIIRSLVNDAAKAALIDHLSEFDPHNILAKVRKEKYVKQDGTVPFKAPQKGIDAVDPQDLVTLHQLEEKFDDAKQPVWITSGPVETTVGLVEDGTLLPERLTLQETLDAIFYGKRIKITAPDTVQIGTIAPITVCIQGTLETIQHIEIYQGEQYLDTVTREQLLESGCVTIDSLPIDSDTTINVKVFYTNGTSTEVSKLITVSLPIFVGINPRWKQGYVLTYEILQEFATEDPDNNKFYYEGKDVSLIEHSFNFDKNKEQKIIVALPANYSDLVEMSNSAQVVTQSAFEVIDMIPFQVAGKDEVYKIYTYKQDLYSLNTTMKFKFE